MELRFPSTTGLQAPGAPASKPVAGAAGAAGFASTLSSALETVSKLQAESASLQQQFQLGAEGASLEKTMVAMQKSQIAFQAALTVRNRLVGAYTDIMNMQV
jgi:flagellar hook-basal body complex protein FliE